MGCCFSDPVVETVPAGTAYAVRCEPMYQVPQGYGQQVIMQGQGQPQGQVYDPYQPQAYVQPQGQAIAYQQPQGYGQAQGQAIAYQQPQGYGQAQGYAQAIAYQQPHSYSQPIPYYPYQPPQSQGNI